MRFVNTASLVPQTVKAYLEREIREGGLLEDVETLIPSVNSDVPVDPPAIWIVQHPTTRWVNDKANLSNKITLSVPFEFVCVEYSDDLEEAEILGISLASRVGSSLMKNFNKVKVDDSMPNRFFHKLEFETLYPVGEVTVVGKSERIPATSIIFNFVYIVDWLKCNRKYD